MRWFINGRGEETGNGLSLFTKIVFLIICSKQQFIVQKMYAHHWKKLKIYPGKNGEICSDENSGISLI